MQRYELTMSYDAFLSQAYFTGFEMAAYELTLEEINYQNLLAISQEQWNRFIHEDGSVAATRWTIAPHLFESPHYVSAYLPATDGAMQIWEKSVDDPEAGVSTYLAFLNNASNGQPITENLERCGLTSPFAEGEIERQAEWFRNYLIEDVPQRPATEENTEPPLVISPIDPDRYGESFGISDGSHTVTFGVPQVRVHMKPAA